MNIITRIARATKDVEADVRLTPSGVVIVMAGLSLFSWSSDEPFVTTFVDNVGMTAIGCVILFIIEIFFRVIRPRQ